ncbi:MAG: hypothetical protein ACFFG0_03010 [Candidatus Thorarchaeota archaeon]
MVSTEERRKIGKQNRASGQRFENLVRKDLESKGWVCDKWSNNVEFEEKIIGQLLSMPPQDIKEKVGKLVPAKHKFCGVGRPMAIGTGFPDFVAYCKGCYNKKTFYVFKNISNKYAIMGVEVKSNGYLDKEEKEKCEWLLENNIFSKILIAKKGTKRGEIIYEEFK